MLDVDLSEEALPLFDERIREPHIRRREVEKRFKALLEEPYMELWDAHGH